MKTQKSSRFKRFAFITLAMAGMGMVVDGIIPVDAVDPFQGVQNAKAPTPVAVAQSTTQTSTQEKTETPAEDRGSESQTQEKDKSAAPKKKKLKDFRPSEQIEAEQAVDFPYDI